MLLISKIALVTSAQVLTHAADSTINSIYTDSRQVVSAGSDDLFIALRGEHFNGNMFFNDAYAKGIRNFLIDESIDVSSYQNANILLVPNTIVALQQIATSHRNNFTLPIIGITGSNGKTIVKEWLNTLLNNDFTIVKSPGSYNSQIGVPLSVLLLQSKHTLGVFEAGISRPGEMQKLEDIIAPTIGVFTSLGDAHSQHFESEEQKLREKFLLFKNCKTVVLNHQYLDHVRIYQQGFTWSREDKNATIFVSDTKTEVNETIISYVFENYNGKITIPFSDDASIDNAISCLCVGLLLKLKPEYLALHFLEIHAVDMRLALQRGNNDNIIINDAYNNDINSLKNALSFMNRQLHKGEKTMVMSDILQSGKNPELLYQEVNEYLKKYSVHQFIGIGKEISKHKHVFTIPSVFYKSTEEFLKTLNNKTVLFKNSLILLKGARKYHFEELARFFSAQHHTTSLEINLNAIVSNFHSYKKIVDEKTKIMVMVKAFSYGSGSNEIAAILQFQKADYLAVAYADEGVQLRNSGVTLPIMVMNTEEQGFELLKQYHLEPVLFSISQLRQLASFSKESIDVHLEFETGMHRLGFDLEETEEILTLLQQNPNLHLKSVFSHLAAAEDPNEDLFTEQQINTFTTISNKIKKSYPTIIRHLLNSPGIARWSSKAQFDMVRLGIGLYGIDPSGEISSDLIPASTLKSAISQIKKLLPGDSVSYNRRFVAKNKMRIATIPIGYADGLNRALGNGNGFFYIHGKPAPILGTICMDMTMVDVSEINCIENDEVIIFGGQLPVTLVANNAKTISYEVLSTLSQRIKRVYVHE